MRKPSLMSQNNYKNAMSRGGLSHLLCAIILLFSIFNRATSIFQERTKKCGGTRGSSSFIILRTVQACGVVPVEEEQAAA